MFDSNIHFHPNPVFDRLLKIVISALFVCVFAPIKVAMSAELPITLQTLAVLIPSILFGGLTGGLATLIYVICLGLGMPLRPGHEVGPDVLWGLHGGFYHGFVLAAFAVGFIAQRWTGKSWLGMGLLLLIGHIIIIALGLFWKWRLVPPEDATLVLKELSRAAILKVAIGWLLLNLLRRMIERDKKPA